VAGPEQQRVDRVVELIYAVKNQLPYGKVKNKSGEFVKAVTKSVTAAAAAMKDMPADFRVSIVDGSVRACIDLYIHGLLVPPIHDSAKAQAMKGFLSGRSPRARIRWSPSNTLSYLDSRSPEEKQMPGFNRQSDSSSGSTVCRMASSTIASPRRRPGNEGLLARLRGGDQVSYLVTLACAAAIFRRRGAHRPRAGSTLTSHQRSAGAFSGPRRWDPKRRAFWRAAVYLRNVRTSALALLIGVPLGVASAIFLARWRLPNLELADFFDRIACRGSPA